MNTYIVEWNETQEVVMHVIVEAKSERDAINAAQEENAGEVLDVFESYDKKDYTAEIETDNMNNQRGHLCSKCRKRLFNDTIKKDNNGNEICSYCGNVLKYSGVYVDSNITAEETFEIFS